jgi:SAM-dependent methyltransferase
MTWTPEGYVQVCQRWLMHKALVAARPLCSASDQQRELAHAPEGRHARYIPCPLCNSDAYRVFHSRTVKGYAVVQCSACGFLYRNPTYQPAALTEAYNQGYLAFLEGAYSRDRRALYRRVLDELEFGRQTAGYDRRRLLDVGCGHGLFLTVARDLGWEPYGLDFAADCIQHARTAFGLPNAAVGNLTPTSFEPGFFDAVTLWSVAAHLDNPVGMFKNIHRVLRPGGILIIYTVDAGGFMHWLERERWKGFHGNHLVFFTPQTLQKTLAEAGFCCERIAYDNRFLEKAARRGRVSADDEAFFRHTAPSHNLGYMLKAAFRRKAD